jgi:bacteriocin-like protein
MIEADPFLPPGDTIPRCRFNPRTRRIIMQDNQNELPPIEGELTDEDLKQVSGGTIPVNMTGGPPSQNSQGNDNSQGNEDQGNPTHRKFV